MIKYLKTLPHSELTHNLNYRKIPCTSLGRDEEAAHKFNELVKWCEGQNLKKIVRTPSGGISIAFENFNRMYDVQYSNSVVELTIAITEGNWRIQFREPIENLDDCKIYGREAFFEFSNICKKYGIDILKYKIEDFNTAYSFKKKISSLNNGKCYIREVLHPVYIEKTLKNIHHIDLNSSFMANLCKVHTEFLPVAQELYNGRKDNPIYKGVMNNTIGMFHSHKIRYAYAHLAYAAIKGNNDKIFSLVSELKENGRFPILINTDGVWYQGDIYNSPEEGTALGEWKHDHKNCKLLIKSPNCYQYEENGKIKTVASGVYKLDKIKPRDKWEWGDIFNTEEEVYIFKNQRIMKDGVVL